MSGGHLLVLAATRLVARGDDRLLGLLGEQVDVHSGGVLLS